MTLVQETRHIETRPWVQKAAVVAYLVSGLSLLVFIIYFVLWILTGIDPWSIL